MNQGVKKLAEDFVGTVIDLAAKVLHEERKQWLDEHRCIMVRRCNIPAGSRLVECYETPTEYVVIGDPGPGHSCDEMGCSSVSHVVTRWKKAAAQSGGEG